MDPTALNPIEYIAEAAVPHAATPSATGKDSPATKDGESTKDGGSPSGESRAEKKDHEKPPIGVTMRSVVISQSFMHSSV